MGLRSVEPQHPLDASRKLLSEGVAVPYCSPLPTEDTNWKVAFEAPDDITLVGSWPNKISVKPKDGQEHGVDVAVQISDVRVPLTVANSQLTLRRARFRRRTTPIGPKPKVWPHASDVQHEPTPRDPQSTKLVVVSISGRLGLADPCPLS